MLHIDPIRRAEDLNAAPANSTVVGAFLLRTMFYLLWDSLMKYQDCHENDGSWINPKSDGLGDTCRSESNRETMRAALISICGGAQVG
jgi:hypothetical protein